MMAIAFNLPEHTETQYRPYIAQKGAPAAGGALQYSARPCGTPMRHARVAGRVSIT